MEVIPPPTKDAYTIEDFDSLGFHDSEVYGLSWKQESEYVWSLSFDIDYIFRWDRVGDRFRFWVSPCVLSFSDLGETKIELGCSGPVLEQQLDKIIREKSPDSQNDYVVWRWLLDFHDLGGPKASAVIDSHGFEMRVLRTPVMSESQSLGR
ncbi:MAG: hypothetical protein AAGJ97_14245 [Planctomycetota bacterium]